LKGENPLSLSGGQRLRVALASIFSMQPKVILLDEPTSGQDKSNSDSMLQYLYTLSKRGTTILFTTHDIEAAIRYLDRLLIMNNGKIIADGPPRKIAGEIKTLKRANLRPPASFEIGEVLSIEAFCIEDLVRRVVCSG
jgi:energy-coupling factor transport system ATP-binding protein